MFRNDFQQAQVFYPSCILNFSGQCDQFIERPQKALYRSFFNSFEKQFPVFHIGRCNKGFCINLGEPNTVLEPRTPDNRCSTVIKISFPMLMDTLFFLC